MDLEDRMTLTNAEGIDLDVALAGIGSRGAALLLDGLLCGAILLVGVWAFGFFGDIGAAGAALLVFVVLVAYPIAFEGLNHGRTPGKAAIGLQVVAVDGSPITFLAAAIRGFVRMIDALPGMFLVGMISILATEHQQRLGDLAAGTVVVHHPSDRARRRTEALIGTDELLGIERVLSPEAAGWDVTAVSGDDLAIARTFLQRRSTLTLAHRNELARQISLQLLPKVAGVPLDGGPERFIERVVSARTSR